MKKMLVSLCLTIPMTGFASTGSRCQEYSAQVIGKVIDWQQDASTGGCSFKLQFTYFRPHVLCPLNIGDARKTKFPDKDCKLKNGDTQSGVLVEDGLSGAVYLEQ